MDMIIILCEVNMINRYRFGKPISTEAIVYEFENSTGSVPYFIYENGQFVYAFSENDIVYGLGEAIRGINKRGWKYESWNTDTPHHHEDINSLYGAHNFIIIDGNETFGAFFDYPGRILWDIDYTQRGQMVIKPDSMDIDVYIITGDCKKDIVNQFRKIIGKSYEAPLWALGYGQSRWGYKNEKDIREVYERYTDEDVPLDSIYLDIDYMDDYKDFSVSKERFSDLQKLTDDMRKNGIHLVPIIDAGVKIEQGYDVYDEGVANNYFCKKENGEDFVGAVWPGRVHFPDFMQERVREWFGNKYSRLVSLGIDGFWNDMNEPAIFYSDESLKECFERIDELKSKDMGIKEFFEFTGRVGSLSNSRRDYDSMFHNVDGEMIKHSDVHNLYGMNMTRAAYEALKKINPDKKTLLFSRASYIGAHRYGGIWQGDNKSWWSHILQSMQQLPALNMAGFIFVGCDTGGFGCDATEDLMLRWIQYSIFTPLFRNHSADGTRYQELYRFSNINIAREMIRIRYSMIPYLYDIMLKAINDNEMMFRPLSFDFDDNDSKQVEDQLLLGDEIMIAPVYRQNALGRYVYLPEEMMLVRMRKWNDFDTECMNGGHHYVKYGMDELVFFIRKGKGIPICEPANSTSQLNLKPVLYIGYEVDNDK